MHIGIPVGHCTNAVSKCDAESVLMQSGTRADAHRHPGGALGVHDGAQTFAKSARFYRVSAEVGREIHKTGDRRRAGTCKNVHFLGVGRNVHECPLFHKCAKAGVEMHTAQTG